MFQKCVNHLFNRGFRPNYLVWYLHGEYSYSLPSSSEYMADRSEPPIIPRENLCIVEMVTDVFRESIPSFTQGENIREEPNA